MKALLALLCLLLPAPAAAEWVPATGSYLFPPIMPETEACQFAEERARAEAIRKVTGETLMSEDTLRCAEEGDEAHCSRNSAVWSTIEGYIAETRGRSERTIAGIAGHRQCIVSFEADVRAATGRPDPGFDLGVSLSQPVLRDGENLVISLTPSRPMAVQIFQWLPYRRGEQSVIRIFPNALDSAELIRKPVTIPSKDAARRYDLMVSFPEAMPPARRMVDEYLIAIATYEPLTLRETYSLDDFRRLLAELPRDRSRIVRRAYNIVRGKE